MNNQSKSSTIMYTAIDGYANLAAEDKKIMKMPLVLQYNKQDLTEKGLPITPVKGMERCLNSQLKAPSFSASALTGKEVGSTLIECIKLTVRNFSREITAGTI